MTVSIQCITLLLIMSLSHLLYGQDLSGRWRGALQVQGTSLRIVFHISKTDSTYHATVDSPDQNTAGIPVTTTRVTPPAVTFEIKALGMVYEGTFANDRITGLWKQSGQTLPLILDRDGDDSDRPKR